MAVFVSRARGSDEGCSITVTWTPPSHGSWTRDGCLAYYIVLLCCLVSSYLILYLGCSSSVVYPIAAPNAKGHSM
jgi:hypothetical protein